MEERSFFQREWLSLLILAAPFVLIAIFWDKIPDQVPMHWNLQNEVDSYASKGFGMFALPVFNILLYGLFFLLPRIDPRKENYKLFGSAYATLRLVIITFMFVLFGVIMLVSMGYELNIGLIVIDLVSILFLVLGNMFGKIRFNYFVGIKTPWTLANQDVWQKTHRLGGKVWVIGSIIMLILSFALPFEWLIYIFIAYIAVIVVIPVVYSYKLYKAGGKE